MKLIKKELRLTEGVEAKKPKNFLFLHSVQFFGYFAVPY